MELYKKNLARTLNAVHMEKVDKIPFSYSGPAYMARRQGLKISEFVSDFDKAAEAAVNFCKSHPGIDSIHSPTMEIKLLSRLWLSEVKIPGVDLPDDELWQLHEREQMTQEDYQKIIDVGYNAWVGQYLVEKVGNPMAKVGPYFASLPNTVRRMTLEAGVPIMNGLSTGTPIEAFCGAREMLNFFVDIMEEPELVKKAMDVAMEDMYNGYAANLKAAKPVGAWVGGWRAAPELMSHETWMEFAWPYIRKMIDITLENDVVPVLHFDSCWESELETLKELPAGKCILMLDGTTDMRKARAVLDDRMCIMGDVPSSMLAFATPSQVYDYCVKLIDDVGPKTGLILSSGCDCPLNAKDENVDAMIQASLDYVV